MIEELRRGQDGRDRIEGLWTKLIRLPRTQGGKYGLYARIVDMSLSRDGAVSLF